MNANCLSPPNSVPLLSRSKLEHGGRWGRGGEMHRHLDLQIKKVNNLRKCNNYSLIKYVYTL